MMTVAFYARPVKDNVPDYVKTLNTRLNKEGITLIIFEPYYLFLKKEFGFNLDIATF